MNPAEGSVEMGFSDWKVPRNSQAIIIDMGAPDEV
jgi:hypothetical protein